MPLPSSGQISVGQIRSELSTTEGSIQTLYDASNLPPKATDIAWSDFYGYSHPIVSATGVSVVDSGSDWTVTFTFSRNVGYSTQTYNFDEEILDSAGGPAPSITARTGTFTGTNLTSTFVQSYPYASSGVYSVLVVVTPRTSSGINEYFIGNAVQTIQLGTDPGGGGGSPTWSTRTIWVTDVNVSGEFVGFSTACNAINLTGGGFTKVVYYNLTTVNAPPVTNEQLYEDSTLTNPLETPNTDMWYAAPIGGGTPVAGDPVFVIRNGLFRYQDDCQSGGGPGGGV